MPTPSTPSLKTKTLPPKPQESNPPNLAFLLTVEEFGASYHNAVGTYSQLLAFLTMGTFFIQLKRKP